jgi:hypothetical protein
MFTSGFTLEPIFLLGVLHYELLPSFILGLKRRQWWLLLSLSSFAPAASTSAVIVMLAAMACGNSRGGDFSLLVLS